jgi:hypothetical protein
VRGKLVCNFSKARGSRPSSHEHPDVSALSLDSYGYMNRVYHHSPCGATKESRTSHQRSQSGSLVHELSNMTAYMNGRVDPPLNFLAMRSHIYSIPQKKKSTYGGLGLPGAKGLCLQSAWSPLSQKQCGFRKEAMRWW